MACGGGPPSAKWLATLPGRYEGVEKGFHESVELKSNGTFEHEVVVNGNTKLSESGTWLYDQRRHGILVTPFTSFFDQATRKVTQNGSKNTQDVLFTLVYGKKAQRLSPSVDFEFTLFRVEPYNEGRKESQTPR